jgi:hypothetical protein
MGARNPRLGESGGELIGNGYGEAELIWNDCGWAELIGNDYGWAELIWNDYGWAELIGNGYGEAELIWNDCGWAELIWNGYGEAEKAKVGGRCFQTRYLLVSRRLQVLAHRVSTSSGLESGFNGT